MNTTTIYNNNYSTIHNYFLSKRVDYELADNLTHDTLTKAILNIDKYKSDTSLKAWLYCIAKNTLINYKKNKHNKSNKIEITSIEITDTVISSDCDDLMMFLKQKLSAEEYIFVKLYFIDQYKIKELTVLYNKDAKTIKNKVYYLKKKIKELVVNQ